MGPDTREAPTIPQIDVSDISSACSPNGVPQSVTEFLPSEVDARRFAEAVSYNLGQSQHFIDPRLFSDALDRVYQNPSSAADTLPVDFLELLFVLAVGNQISGDGHHPEESIPGERLFKIALSRLPTFSELTKIGIPVVNMLALAAVYFQNVDMTEDAYFYVCLPDGRPSFTLRSLANN